MTGERVVAFDYIADGPLSDELMDALIATFDAHGVKVEGASDVPAADLYDAGTQ